MEMNCVSTVFVQIEARASTFFQSFLPRSLFKPIYICCYSSLNAFLPAPCCCFCVSVSFFILSLLSAPLTNPFGI